MLGPLRMDSRSLRRLAACAALVPLVAGASGCSSARPELPRRPQDRHVMRAKGAEVIAKAVAAHGGMEHWNRIKEMNFRLTDEWQSPLDRLLNPWPVDRVSGQNSYRVHEGWGRVAFVTDRGTVVYGAGATGPWAMVRGQPSPEPKDQRDASYVVPLYGYMAGVPFRFMESGAVAHYLGKVSRKYMGAMKEFEEVLVTYPPEGDYFPNDWFVARFDPQTYELRSVTYTTTGRASKVFETTCDLSEYKTIDSVRIATRHTCAVSSPFEAPLHEWTLADVRFNQVSPDAYFNIGAWPGASAGTPDSARGPTGAQPASGASGARAGAAAESTRAAKPTTGAR